MSKSTFVYVAYIRTTAEKLWAALTDAEFNKQYWFGCHCETEWTKGAPWKLISPDGHVLDKGEVLESDRPRRIVIRWENQKPELKAEGATLCTIELEPSGPAVKLSITHTSDRESSKVITAVSGGWPKVISNLKSLLETGVALMTDPYPSQSATAGNA